MKKYRKYGETRSYVAFWIAFVGLIGSIGILIFEIKY